MSYMLYIVILIEIYTVLSLSLNVVVGYAGLVTLAQAALYGVGAYVATLLMVNLHWGFLPALLLAVVGTVLSSFLITAASMRFKGDYFILAALAFQVIVYSVINNWVTVTKGPFGIAGIPKPDLFGIHLDSLLTFSLFGLVITVMVGGLIYMVLHSAFGRTLQAIRDDEIAATTLGKKASSFKIRSIAISAGCAAVAGTLYATFITYIDPSTFTTDDSLLLLCMVLLGGTGNFKGPIVGAVILVLLPEALRLLAIPDSVSANLRMIIYGIALIVMMLVRPQGIAGKYKFES
ncbi:MAG TPA: branched-chain amino acid ABC transporter permease [Candidatus Acidoferrales bacterium]|nr:branched-chain amino acid ABC transporter permease [Candidatus Acidoferrales bacterium]